MKYTDLIRKKMKQIFAFVNRVIIPSYTFPFFRNYDHHLIESLVVGGLHPFLTAKVI